MSKPYILNTLIIYAKKIEITPQKEYYESLQIDEFWTYVGNKSNKVWLLYVYSAENQEVVSYIFGDRSENTV